MRFVKILFVCFQVITGCSRLSIVGNKLQLDNVYINNGTKAEGLLINSRMIQGISDGFTMFPYPDTKKWDANRNVEEFIVSMEHWKKGGLNGFTIGLQGGGPTSNTKKQNQKNSAFNSDGSLKPAYMNRLGLVLRESNRLDMIVIISLFYQSQVSILLTYDNIVTATLNVIHWLQENEFSNVIIEPVNECDYAVFSKYNIGCDQKLTNIMELVRSYHFPVGNSYKGSGNYPSDSIIKHSDVILLHGNSMNTIKEYDIQLAKVKSSAFYKNQPIIYNEAGIKSFLSWAIQNDVGWGYYDQGTNNYNDGFQSPPINWSINTKDKVNFFEDIKKIFV